MMLEEAEGRRSEIVYSVTDVVFGMLMVLFTFTAVPLRAQQRAGP